MDRRKQEFGELVAKVIVTTIVLFVVVMLVVVCARLAVVVWEAF